MVFTVFITCGYVMAEEEILTLPSLYIKSVNPGYTVDTVSNVGEMIEIGRNDPSHESILLAGITVGYTNSSGNYSILFEFPENSWMNGETLLLRLASSPESELASVNYKKTIAFKGGIQINKGEDIIDAVCWTSKDGCYGEFKSNNPTTLVRNLDTNRFEHMVDYYPVFDAHSYEVVETKEETLSVDSKCKGLMFSELLSYYDAQKSEQFVEIYNYSSEQIHLNNCKIGYKNKSYNLDGIIKPEGYYVYYPLDFVLTKNPTNFNTLELFDVNGEIVDRIDYPNGQRKGTSYALIGYDGEGREIWKTTYASTPGEPNNYQEFKSCEEGKVINGETGNCVKMTSVSQKTCKVGYYLNPSTGRCRKVQTKQERICKEGYYLNLETNRCKKIRDNTGANYEIKPTEYKEESSFVALYIVIGVIIVGLAYLVFEFRKELVGFMKKIFSFLGSR